MVQVAIFLFASTFQVESTGTGSLHKIEEESPQEKEAREKFEAGQALLNSSRGDKIQVNTVQQGCFQCCGSGSGPHGRLDPDPSGQKRLTEKNKNEEMSFLRCWVFPIEGWRLLL